MGTYTAPPEKAGRKCVVKELKESYTWNASDWDTTLKIHQQAQSLAFEFNKFINRQRLLINVSFTEIDVQPVINTGNPYKRPKLGEHVIVEDYITGNFEKWLNNYGYVSPRVSSGQAQAMPAFAHWSWWYTRGEMMIADLQGVRYENAFTSMTTYILTDPVLMSGSVDGGCYGCTDTGVEGIAMFFLNHQCNDFCKKIPTPTIQTIFQALGIPQSQIASVTQQLQQIVNATAYSRELKLPPDIRSRLVEPLKTKAQQQLYQ